MPLPPPCAHLELYNHLHNVRQKKKLQWQFLLKQHPGGKQGRFVPDKNQWERILPKFLQKKSFHYVYDFMTKEDKLAFLPVAFWFLVGPRERNLLETFQCYTEPLITSIDFSALQTVGRVTSTPVTLTDLDTEGTEPLHSRKAIIFCEKK